MRALLPVLQDDVDLHEWYARDWLETGGVRFNFVASVDGAGNEKGYSRGLQTPGDNRVFAALRDLADVVLAGAGTVRTEGYRAIDLGSRRRALRRELGISEELPTAVVSRSLAFDPEASLFVDAPPSARTVVITVESADSEALAALRKVADVVLAGSDSVDFQVARDALIERGLGRIVCEGGPTIFAEMAAQEVSDELCLSITPMLTGPGASRIVAGATWPFEPRALDLTGLLEEEGALFCRYRVRQRPAVTTVDSPGPERSHPAGR
jgi:riboflavin biosynthesis pyrimidine reductase